MDKTAINDLYTYIKKTQKSSKIRIYEGRQKSTKIVSKMPLKLNLNPPKFARFLTETFPTNVALQWSHFLTLHFATGSFLRMKSR